MKDIFDFYVMTATGNVMWKSKMDPMIWKGFYPTDSVQINGFIYRLVSKDIVDIYVASPVITRIRQRQDWGKYRLFLHHNGRAMMSSNGEDYGVGEHIGTTFGVIYEDMKIIHKFFFSAPDREFQFDMEEFNVARPVL